MSGNVLLGSRCHGHVMALRCNACLQTRKIPAPPILDIDPEQEATAAQQTLSESDIAPESPQPPGPSGQPLHCENLESASEVNVSAADTGKKPRRKKIKVVPRLPPLFERRVGHVVYCGTEVLSEQDQLGPLFASNIGPRPT